MPPERLYPRGGHLGVPAQAAFLAQAALWAEAQQSLEWSRDGASEGVSCSGEVLGPEGKGLPTLSPSPAPGDEWMATRPAPPSSPPSPPQAFSPRVPGTETS